MMDYWSSWTVKALKYWPTGEWQASLPEKQGMDPKILDEAYDYLNTNFPALRQITIIRHGYIVFHRDHLDAHEIASSVIFRKILQRWSSLFGCPPETFQHNHKGRWNIRSATKSVTSILMGKVIADKLIDGLDQPVAEILPDYFVDIDEPKKRQITIRHLLTMTSGLRSVEGGITSIKMLASRNWTRFMVHLPLEHNPGGYFTYNSANPHLISAVISKVTGKSILDYGNDHLFLPLGIRNVIWGAAPEGIGFGGGNLFLSSQELAKIGLLFLHQGVWENEQLIPSAWVSESLQPYQILSSRDWWTKTLGHSRA